MNPDGNYLCVGDQVGKIYYYLFESKEPTISTRHWHSNAVNVLEFTKDNSILLSGGKEAVVVLWHNNVSVYIYNLRKYSTSILYCLIYF